MSRSTPSRARGESARKRSLDSVPDSWPETVPGDPPADAASGGTITMTVQGELDLATADSLYRRGRAAIARHAQLLLLDLTGVSFCDSRGLAAFVRIANDADVAGCRYGLIAPQPLVAKVLRITHLDERLPVFRTIEEARRRFSGMTAAAPG